MKWQVPAKTFLLGEYAALTGGSSLVITTTPYFELSLTTEKDTCDIHPQSPAGKWWNQKNHPGVTLSWYDPYHARGGLGASSAQFLACYWATCYLENETPHLDTMLDAYYQSSWTGEGLRPSGYDVIAQAQRGCVYINKQKKIIQSYKWPFRELSFLILHTGVKLATHHHLLETTLPAQIDYLSHLVDEAKQAFEQEDNTLLINSINKYYQTLLDLKLVAPHSKQLIQALKENPEILALKGCGALGADTILIITKKTDMPSLREKLIKQDLLVIASENELAKTSK